MGAHPGLCAGPEVCIHGGRLHEPGVPLERMGPAWDLETAVAKRNRPLKSPRPRMRRSRRASSPASLGLQPDLSKPVPREALCVPCDAGAGLAGVQPCESAASLRRPRPSPSPARVLAAAGGRETEARSAEMRARLRAPRPEWAGCRGRGAGWAPGAAGGHGGDVRDPRPGTARTALPGRPRGGAGGGWSAQSPHRRGGSGVPAPAQPSGRGQEAAVTV